MYYCRVKGSKQPIYVKYRILVGVAKGREIFPSRFLRSILQEWKFWWDKNFVNAFVSRFAEKKEHVKKCRSVIFNLRFSLPIYTYVSNRYARRSIDWITIGVLLLSNRSKR